MNGKNYNKTILLNYGLIICLSFFAMALGGAIYLFFRSTVPTFFYKIHFAGFEEKLISVRQTSVSFGLHFPNWTIYSLPNGLWAFAYTLLILFFWWGSTSKQKYFWLASIPALVFGFEILQLTAIPTGTFCWQDIVSGIIGILFALLIGVKLKL
jgi:hypothetical protein